MRFRHLDINLLVALEAILTHKSVTKAAEHLCLSQSATSGILARLRAHFEDELVVRSGRRMELTSLAEELMLPLRAILSETEKLLATRGTFDPSTSERQFTIACSDYVWLTVVTELMSELRCIAPSVNILYQGPGTRFDKASIDFVIAPDEFMLVDCPFITLPTRAYVCIVWSVMMS